MTWDSSFTFGMRKHLKTPHLDEPMDIGKGFGLHESQGDLVWPDMTWLWCVYFVVWPTWEVTSASLQFIGSAAQVLRMVIWVDWNDGILQVGVNFIAFQNECPLYAQNSKPASRGHPNHNAERFGATTRFPQPHHTGFFLVLIHLCFKFQDPYGPNSFLYTRNSPRPKGRAWTVLAGIVAECRGELEVLVADLSRVSPSAEFLWVENVLKGL